MCVICNATVHSSVRTNRSKHSPTMVLISVVVAMVNVSMKLSIAMNAEKKQSANF